MRIGLKLVLLMAVLGLAVVFSGCFLVPPPSVEASFYNAYCQVSSRRGLPGCTIEISYSLTNTGDLPLASASFEARWWNWKEEIIHTYVWTESLLTGYYARPLMPGETRNLIEYFSLDTYHLFGYEAWTMEITALEAYSD